MQFILSFYISGKRRTVCHRDGDKIPMLNLVLPFKYFLGLENERNSFILNRWPNVKY